MGFHKVIYLYCNGNSPDCESAGNEACEGGSTELDTIAEYRKAARKMGWLFKAGNKAYCPACRKEDE